MKFLVVMCFVLALGTPVVQAQAPASAVADFRAYTRDLQSLAGKFTQEVRDKNGRVSRQSSGSFIIARPGKFRFVYERPYQQTIVSDGATVWLHDQDLNQVTIRKLGDAVSEQPLALLLDPAAADKLFDLKAAESAGSIQFVDARSRKADAPFSDLRIAMVALQPSELVWRDALQNVNTLRFGELSKNGRVAADAFSFTPPKGADILKQ
ncbi:MAG: outer membrane lipoprotein chaperone LolA [Burkholderiales bacterium]|nr:outer membrane lipoprotein chaperone LolA [Burkholderiales bacterium]